MSIYITMVNFLRLTNFVLNASTIQKIVIKPNKYHIYIVGKQINGFNWLIGGFGLGNISSHTEEIEVCEKEHSLDYQIVSEWIHKNM
jgi:hypothetical protein